MAGGDAPQGRRRRGDPRSGRRAEGGVSRRMLRSNPVVDAAPRVCAGRRSARPEPEQIVALLAAAVEESTRAGLAMRLAATGAREAEIVALAWDHLEGDQLRIRRHGIDGQAVIRDKTQTASSRMSPSTRGPSPASRRGTPKSTSS